MNAIDEDSSADDALTFLFSSFTRLPRSFFQGYAFSGPDLVIGQEGARAFLAEHGQHVLPGEDGCYVSIVPSADGPVIGVDHAGFKKLFCYAADGVWCVSNSLSQMADHLRSHGVALAPHSAQLAALRLRSTFVEQLSTPTTVFADIRLIPRDTMLVLTERGPRTTPAPSPPPPATYSDALLAYIDAWRARLLTLINDPSIDVSVDLSGGLDSRVVFALAASAAGDRPLDESMRLISGKSVAQRPDFVVARQIADRYGAKLNRPSPGSTPSYSPAESFKAWRDLCLGVYLPIYIPKAPISPRHANLSGLGGESHRTFYPQQPSRSFVESIPGDADPESLELWRSDVTSLLEGWRLSDSTRHPLVRHYQEFRARFHGGLFAQTKINLTPLASKLLDPLARASFPERRFYFEILENTLQGLMDMPFDVEAKAATASERNSLVRVSAADEIVPGRVFSGEMPLSATEGGGPTPLERIADEFEDAASPSVRELLGHRLVEDASSLLQASAETGSFGHARRASDVSRVLTAAMVLHDRVGRAPQLD
ncbi:hypothetical protein [Agrococcus sp. Marseille-P2731]|uniref:hypothetical protein n=1 Tax=Agrococcus sp. Marseille-P2731 TaxID=1841862 RepID=UPI0009319DB6|nr:hypothetical protein [Agrococcus sp. Marseille-P2731]